MANESEIKTLVKARYNKFADSGGVIHFRAPNNEGPGIGKIGQKLYKPQEIDLIPDFAFYYSMGCTTPLRNIEIKPGSTILDLGCGVGIDVILASRKTGPEGHVYGLDISSSLIKLAKKAVKEAGCQENVTLIEGDMENIPLADNSVDIIISNGSINASFNKKNVFKEAYRVLKHGGKMAINDIVATEKIEYDLLKRLQKNWQGCIGGGINEGEAFDLNDYLKIVSECGFTNISLISKRILSPEELNMMLVCPREDITPPPKKEDVGAIQGKMASIKFIAKKEY